MEWLVFFGAALPAMGLILCLARFSRSGQGRDRLKKMKQGRSSNPLPRHKAQDSVPWLKSLEYLLISAGIKVSARTFLAVPFMAGILSAVVLFALTQSPALALAVFGLALALPAAFLYFKKKQLQRAIISEMPDAIGMVVRALQIGQTVDRALKDAANALSGPLGTEIRIVYQETAMGISFENALKNLKNRYPSLPDITLFSTAFIIQRETGGNLVDILEALADTIRKRFTFNQKIKTYSAEARLSAIIIALMPFLFALFALVFNPEYISRLTATPQGRFMLWLAAILEVSGFMVMYRMTRIKG